MSLPTSNILPLAIHRTQETQWRDMIMCRGMIRHTMEGYDNAQRNDQTHNGGM